MKLTLEAVPSPRNSNHERLFMCKLPRGVDRERVQLALDSALKRRADDRYDRRRPDDDDRRHGRHGHDEEERNLAELRRKLEHVLSQNLSDEAYSAALDALNEHLPEGGRTYGDEESEREWYQHEDKPREPREPDGEDEEGEIPRNAHEGGMGGATKVYGDRRRGARDSRLVAMDARDSFEAMFPGVSRIKPATSFR
jgi:hypothetical protein